MREKVARLRESFWFVPGLFGVAALLLAQALVSLDRYLLDASSLNLNASLIYEVGASGSRDILGAIAGSMLGVAATSFSITISVLATTSSTYGPRLVRNFMADRGNQVVLGVFGATFLYSLMVLRSIRSLDSDGSTFVPDIAVNVAVLLAVIGVGVLVYFIHHIAQSVQVSTLSARVRRELTTAVDEMYPAEHPDDSASAVGLRYPPVRTTVTARGSGVVVDHDESCAVDVGTELDGLIVVHRAPGEHVIEGEVLVEICTEAGTTPSDESIDRLRDSFELGDARTPRHDISFAVEQMTELAVRALSTGVNDPYTARNALDDVSVGLVSMAQRPGPSGAKMDANGTIRVVLRRIPVVELIDHTLDAVRIYGMGSPMVIEAGIRLAERVGRAAREETTVDAVLAHLSLLQDAASRGDGDPTRTTALIARIGRTRTAVTERIPLGSMPTG